MITVTKLKILQSLFFIELGNKKKEKYPDDENLYPGIYIKEIAEKIIKEILN